MLYKLILVNCGRLNIKDCKNRTSPYLNQTTRTKKPRQTPLSVLVDQLLKPNCLGTNSPIVNPLPPISINYPNHPPVVHPPVVHPPVIHPQIVHPPIVVHPTHTHLYCYSCNGNQLACRTPVDITKIKDHLVPCNGQCMQYRNPYDNLITYRGCSWDMGLMIK